MSPNLYDAVMSRTWRADVDTRGYSTDLDRILQEAGKRVYPTTIATSLNAETITTTSMMPKEAITKVIFNDPATIVFWSNGEKTVVKCCENDVYDPEKGLAMAICKYIFGNDNYFHRVFKDWLPEEKDEEFDVDLFSKILGNISNVSATLGKLCGNSKKEDNHAEQ